MHQDIRSIQAPLKARYLAEPQVARVTLVATGQLDDQAIACNVETGRAMAKAGLHPATGGDGSLICSGDMLLQALVACAGVTLKAVAESMEIRLEGGRVTAEGDLDFRGTLGVGREAQVGFTDIRLRFELATDAPPDKVLAMQRLTERYCVVYQTLEAPAQLSTEFITNRMVR